MQLLLYLFIGAISAISNIVFFAVLFKTGIGISVAIVLAFVVAALVNYLLCIAILFRHKARWSTMGEIATYVLTVAVMGAFDFVVALSLLEAGWSPVASKSLATLLGFVGNFLLRRYLVFPEKSVTVSQKNQS